MRWRLKRRKIWNGEPSSLALSQECLLLLLQHDNVLLLLLDDLLLVGYHESLLFNLLLHQLLLLLHEHYPLHVFIAAVSPNLAGLLDLLPTVESLLVFIAHASSLDEDVMVVVSFCRLQFYLLPFICCKGGMMSVRRTLLLLVFFLWL